MIVGIVFCFVFSCFCHHVFVAKKVASDHCHLLHQPCCQTTSPKNKKNNWKQYQVKPIWNWFEPGATRDKMSWVNMTLDWFYRKVSFTISRHWTECCADIVVFWQWDTLFKFICSISHDPRRYFNRTISYSHKKSWKVKSKQHFQNLIQTQLKLLLFIQFDHISRTKLSHITLMSGAF